MIKDDRRLWKLILLTIPTLGIYNIYFWYRFTKDLNEINQEEKKIKNYFLVLFLSIITLGIYRWVWLFYIEDRLQTTGKKMGISIHPGPGTTLVLWTFGKFILFGPFLADFYIINNMNKLATAYNASLPKKKKKKKKEVPVEQTKKEVPMTNTAKPGNQTIPNEKTAANKPVLSEPNRQTITTPASAMNRSTKPAENKAKVINKQVITPEKKTAVQNTSGTKTTTQKTTAAKPAAQKNTAAKNTEPKSAAQKTAAAKNTEPKSAAQKTTAAKPANSKTSTNKAASKPGTVALDVEKNRPRANDATLTVNPGLTNMPMGKEKNSL